MKNKTSTKNILIISVKPRFADLILTGEKTYELRRIKPNIKKNDRILLYVTAPRKELIATLSIENVYEEKIYPLYKLVKGKCGLNKTEFMTYFRDKDKGYAIKIKKVFRLSNPINWEELQRIDFHPPQLYQYAKEDLLNLVKCRIS